MKVVNILGFQRNGLVWGKERNTLFDHFILMGKTRKLRGVKKSWVKLVLKRGGEKLGCCVFIKILSES